MASGLRGAVAQGQRWLAQQLPPAREGGEQGATHTDARRLEGHPGRETQQLDGVGAVEAGQAPGDLPHQCVGQEYAQPYAKAGADQCYQQQLKGKQS